MHEALMNSFTILNPTMFFAMFTMKLMILTKTNFFKEFIVVELKNIEKMRRLKLVFRQFSKCLHFAQKCEN